MPPKPRYWTCHNTTQATLIGDKIRKADHYFSRLIGLLPKSGLNAGEGLWIMPCNDIHSVGMRFEFDAIFLDTNLVVIHLIERMKPLRLSPMIKGGKTVLELPGGTIQATRTQVGDQLQMEPSNS